MLTILPKMNAFRPKWRTKAWKFGIKIAQKYWVYGLPISETPNDNKGKES